MLIRMECSTLLFIIKDQFILFIINWKQRDSLEELFKLSKICVGVRKNSSKKDGKILQPDCLRLDQFKNKHWTTLFSPFSSIYKNWNKLKRIKLSRDLFPPDHHLVEWDSATWTMTASQTSCSRFSWRTLPKTSHLSWKINCVTKKTLPVLKELFMKRMLKKLMWLNQLLQPLVNGLRI